MFLLSLFWPALFPFFFFSLSLSLSLLLILFFSSFLSFLYVFFGFLFFSLSLFVCLLCCCFMKGTTSKDSIIKFFFINPLFFSFLSCFLFEICFLLSLFFLIFSYVFFNINVVGFKTHKLKKHNFWVKRGVATKRLFLSTCVFKIVKSYRFFGGPFLDKYWVMFKQHYKNRYFGTFLKTKNGKKWPFSMVTNWAMLMVTNWAMLAPH